MTKKKCRTCQHFQLRKGKTYAGTCNWWHGMKTTAGKSRPDCHTLPKTPETVRADLERRCLGQFVQEVINHRATWRSSWCRYTGSCEARHRRGDERLIDELRRQKQHALNHQYRQDAMPYRCLQKLDRLQALDRWSL